MKKSISFLVDTMLRNHIIEAEKAEICRTGLELIISDIIGFSLILIAGLLTDTVVFACVYLIMMCCVRKFCGGFHANSYWLCRTVSVGTYIAVIIVNYLITEHEMAFTLFFDIFSLVTIAVFAPVRHPNKTLTDTEVKANKFFSVISAFVFSILSVVLTIYRLRTGLVIAIIMFAIAVLMYAGMIANKRREVI